MTKCASEAKSDQSRRRLRFERGSHSKTMADERELIWRGRSKQFVTFLPLWLMSSFLIAYPGYFEPWGKESDLKAPGPPRKVEKISFATQLADVVIHFHQQIISPVDGPRSHYRPTSSQYMHLAMHRYGFFKGFIMGCDRLLRENDEKWVYRSIQIDGKTFKYDPAKENKYD